MAPAAPAQSAGPVAPAAPTAPTAPAATDPTPGIPGLYPQAGASGYSQPAGGGAGDIRVSLTGQVMDVPAPTPRGTGPGGYGPPAGGPASRGPAGAAGPTRGRYGLPAQEAPAKSGSGGIIAVVLLVLVLAGGGAFGWWWYNNRTNPKEQAQKALNAINQRDWKGFFALCAWPPNVRVGPGDADTFARVADASFNQSLQNAPEAIRQAVNNMKMTAGEPVISGSTADVPTSTLMTIGPVSVTLKGTAHMIRQAGIWKLDMTKGNPQDPSVWEKIGADLVGKPEGMPPGLGGGMGGMRQ
jgi:hypothetical protein